MNEKSIFMVALLILGAIAVMAYWVYKIWKDQKEFEIEEEKNMTVIIKKPPKNILDEQLTDESFNRMLSHSSHSLDKLDELRLSIQSELRKAVKEKNIQKSRACNAYLKKIDVVERSLRTRK